MPSSGFAERPELVRYLLWSSPEQSVAEQLGRYRRYPFLQCLEIVVLWNPINGSSEALPKGMLRSNLSPLVGRGP